jgi:MFS transporter, MHS family, shikimate and dehydroshikimate transport protein
VGVGLFIRLRLSETPAFNRIRQSQTIARRPLLEVITQQPKAFFIAVGMKVSEVAWVYVLTVFSIVYATSKLGLSRSVILNGIFAAAMLEVLTIPLFGALSDRIGRKPMYITGALLSAAIAFPIFWLLDTKDPSIILITIAVAMSITHGAMFGPQAAYMPELFGTRMRYSGASLGCQISAAISGGFSPIIAAALLGWAGATWPVSLYLVGLALITLIAVLASHETFEVDISQT